MEIRLGSSTVAQQINFATESDIYGEESIIPKEGHRVYRYKEVAVMLYSFGLTEWVLGCFEDFGTGDKKAAYTCIINRYLSWALAPMGIVGFWGELNGNDIVILKRRESEGNAIFIDIRENKIISLKGIHALSRGSKIVRFDDTLGKGEVIRMQKEQLASFLTQYTSYLDYLGPSVPIRQAVSAIIQRLDGIISPQNGVATQTDLPL